MRIRVRNLQDLLAGDRAQGFDLASGMLLRVYLLRMVWVALYAGYVSAARNGGEVPVPAR